MKVKYTSNNSGGSWWLKDEDWAALEEAGWDIGWGQAYFCHSQYPSLGGDRPGGDFIECAEGVRCHGHRAVHNYAMAKGGKRFLGSLAQSASKDFEDMASAIREWERITKQQASDEGCNCCGPPHAFSTDEPYRYASGDDIVDVLYPNAPSSRRAAAEAQR